jgi:hypothetical protein
MKMLHPTYAFSCINNRIGLKTKLNFSEQEMPMTLVVGIPGFALLLWAFIIGVLCTSTDRRGLLGRSSKTAPAQGSVAAVQESRSSE